MANHFSNFSLTMVNLWVGLCKGDPGLPTLIRDLGYRHLWVELKFNVDKHEHVEPDMMIGSKVLGHTLLLEWKSGLNLKPDQLRRYGLVSGEALKTRALLDPDECESHDVAIVCLSENRERLEKGMDPAGHAFPLLVADSSGLALTRNEFVQEETTRAFRPRLALDWERVPRYLRVNQDSELAEFAEILVPTLLKLMKEKHPRIDLTQLATAICQTWPIMGKPARDGIKARVRELLVLATGAELREFVRWNKSRSFLQIVLNPFDLVAEQKTNALRRLRTATRKLIARLSSEADEARQLDLPGI